MGEMAMKGAAGGNARAKGAPDAVYLDYQATTPVDPRVLDAMLPYFSELFGNPHSRQHAFGWQAEDAVERARAEVAGLIGASAREIVFHVRCDGIEQPGHQGGRPGSPGGTAAKTATT